MSAVRRMYWRICEARKMRTPRLRINPSHEEHLSYCSVRTWYLVAVLVLYSSTNPKQSTVGFGQVQKEKQQVQAFIPFLISPFH